MKKMSYDVVIVNFNGEKIISSCLDSLLSCSHKPKKIIIYDNNSEDNSLELIKDKYPKALLVRGRKNIGFGRGNNEGMRRSSADFILFMNNDLVLDKECPSELLRAFSDKKLAIVNPVIYKGWKKIKNQEVYAFGAEMNTSGFGYGLYDLDGNRFDLDCFSGACFMARSKTIKKLQFEKKFFLYCEEPEISARVLKRGEKIGRIIEAKSYHLESFSSPQRRVEGIAFRQYYSVQNRWFMVGKHWPKFLLPKVLLVNELHLLYLVYFFMRNGQWKYLRLVYMAPYKFFLGLREFNSGEIDDKRWFVKLSRTPLGQYFRLGSKVFAGPKKELVI